MGLKVTNNAFGTLNAGINSSVTTVVLSAGEGARFPTLTASDYFYATLIDTSNNLEIVKVTARSTDTMTIVRAQDNTTARAFSTNDRFELRPTAVLFNEVITTAEAALPKAGGVMASGGRIQFQNAEGHTLYGIRGTRYGYSSSYRSLQIGNGANSENIALNVDVSAIAGGAFTGNGKDIVVPNAVIFSMPNSGNTDFVAPMRFDSAGRVLMPLQPAFMAYRSSGAVSGTGVFICNNTTFNDGSHFNTTTGKFTAPVDGRYQCNFFVLMQNGNNVDINIYVNNAMYASMDIRDNNATSGNFTLSVSGVLKLSANDTANPQITYQPSGSVYGSGLNGFSMYLLG